MSSDTRPETLNDVARRIADMTREERDAVFPPRFFTDESPKYDIWKPMLAVVMPLRVVDYEFERYLEKPRVHQSVIAYYKTYFGYYSDEKRGAIWPRADEGLGFDPTQDQREREPHKRMTRDDAVRTLALLAEDPHPFVTVASLHSFFDDYIVRLQDRTIRDYRRVFGERRLENLGDTFACLSNVFGQNGKLFAGQFLMPLVLTGDAHARAQGRPPGPMTQQSFEAFLDYASPGNLFAVRRPETDEEGLPTGREETTICPWAAHFRMAARETTAEHDHAGLVTLKAGRLWRLHETVRDRAEEMAPELKQMFKRAYWNAVSAFDVPAANLEGYAALPAAPAAPKGCPYHIAKAAATHG